MLGLERFYEGRFEESLVLVQRGLDRYDPVAHRDLANRFGHDPRASATNYKAWNLWHLGFPDQAASTVEENMHWTLQFKHANTTGLVLCMGTMRNIWLRRAEQVESAAREAIRLAEEMTLAFVARMEPNPSWLGFVAERCPCWDLQKSRLVCTKPP
jgi:hypothetical protein